MVAGCQRVKAIRQLETWDQWFRDIEPGKDRRSFPRPTQLILSAGGYGWRRVAICQVPLAARTAEIAARPILSRSAFSRLASAAGWSRCRVQLRGPAKFLV